MTQGNEKLKVFLERTENIKDTPIYAHPIKLANQVS
ncbi:hypothetical protein CPS_4940 [Colwellia psychrerythraea 34H]|uniref:Uncharacterized protein n=1 Tax=Colwellia psychrerythraea (strain 34H / ATCC BAA-681) TaxID=167879 RepID=Q47UE4_COLP3|nr:hypothetical protein CPS_4940 [Colwellia psychrerythraea 34H]